MTLRLCAGLLVAAVTTGTFGLLAVPAQASDVKLCTISITDDTPDTYPGGMHVRTTCV